MNSNGDNAPRKRNERRFLKMKNEETNTNIYYIVYRYNEITNDIENIYESKYPLELVNKYGLNEKHFSDYILKDNENWESSERRFNNMFIIKDTEE